MWGAGRWRKVSDCLMRFLQSFLLVIRFDFNVDVVFAPFRVSVCCVMWYSVMHLHGRFFEHAVQPVLHTQWGVCLQNVRSEELTMQMRSAILEELMF